MKVTVHVPLSHRTVTVNVGRGLQTVRWLATVAAHRARMSNMPRGGRRLREPNLKFIGKFIPESLLVTGTTISLAPNVLVKDAIAGLPPGAASFTVPLHNTYTVSETGGFGVERSLWADSAFASSPIAVQRAQRRQIAHDESVRRSELAALREARKKADEADVRMTRLLMVDLSDPAAVEEVLASTWTHIRVTNLTNDKVQIDKMKRLFLEHYLPLNDLFMHFSGSAGRDTSACMTKAEFEHLLAHCKLLYPDKHKDITARVFTAANADRNDDEDNSEALLTRFELFEAFLMVAMYKYGRTTNKSGFRNTPAEALERVFFAHLLPAAKQLSHGRIRRILKTGELQPWLASKYEQLQHVYRAYASVPLEGPVADDGMSLLTRMQMLLMLRDAGKVSQRAFAATTKQLKEDVLDAIAALGRYEADDQADADLHAPFTRLPSAEPPTELCYSEFMEVVARVSVAHVKRESAKHQDSTSMHSASFRRMARGLTDGDVADYVTRAVNVVRHLNVGNVSQLDPRSRQHRQQAVTGRGSPGMRVNSIAKRAMADPFDVGEVGDVDAQPVNMEAVAGSLAELRSGHGSGRGAAGRGRRRGGGRATSSGATSMDSLSRLTSPIQSRATSRRTSFRRGGAREDGDAPATIDAGAGPRGAFGSKRAFGVAVPRYGVGGVPDSPVSKRR